MSTFKFLILGYSERLHSIHKQNYVMAFHYLYPFQLITVESFDGKYIYKLSVLRRTELVSVTWCLTLEAFDMAGSNLR